MLKMYSRAILICSTVFSFAACGSNFNTPGQTVLKDDPATEQPGNAATGEGDTGNKNLGELTPPSTSQKDKEVILTKYDYLDPDRIVPTKALADAVAYFDQNQSKIANKNYIAVLNFAQSSKEKRFYIIDMKTGKVMAIHVAHGKGSDPDHDSFATKFSNLSGSNASSLGFYTTAETYSGNHGLSLKLDGRSSTNSNARSRAIVIHGADYVQEASMIQGRSWGCPAVSMSLRTQVINMLKGGALINAVYK
jgi:L,D-transpeptidase-like protein